MSLNFETYGESGLNVYDDERRLLAQIRPALHPDGDEPQFEIRYGHWAPRDYEPDEEQAIETATARLVARRLEQS